MQVFFILFSVHFAVYQYINSKCLYRTHVNLRKDFCIFRFCETPEISRFSWAVGGGSRGKGRKKLHSSAANQNRSPTPFPEQSSKLKWNLKRI